MMKMVGIGRNVLLAPRMRKILAVGLVGLGTVLVVLCGFLEWRWLPVLAVLCWLAVCGGAYLSTRLRSGHVIRSLATIEAALGSLSERVVSVDRQSAALVADVRAIEHQLQGVAGEVLNMQLRSYRDLSSQSNALRAQMVELLTETRSSFTDELSSMSFALEQAATRDAELLSLLGVNDRRMHGALSDAFERFSIGLREVDEARLVEFERRQLAAFQNDVQWLAATMQTVSAQVVDSAAGELRSDLQQQFMALTRSLEDMAHAGEASHASHHQRTRDLFAGAAIGTSEELKSAWAKLEAGFDALPSIIAAERRREPAEFAGELFALLENSHFHNGGKVETALAQDVRATQDALACLQNEIERVLAGMSEAAVQQADVSRRHFVQLRAAVGDINGALSSYPSMLSARCDAILASLSDPRRVRSVTTQGMQWMKTEVVQEIESLLRLYELGDKRGFSPLLGGWAMDPAGMLGVLRLIEQADPEVIVELGSGTSTLWIASFLKVRGKGRLVSIDHLAEYGEATSRQLKEMGLDGVAEVRISALELQNVKDQEYSWYGPAAFESIANIDFLLVDGPPTATGPLARYPALPVLDAVLAADAWIVLDDATRRDEQETIRLWRSEGWELHELPGIGARTHAFRLISKNGPESGKDANEK